MNNCIGCNFLKKKNIINFGKVPISNQFEKKINKKKYNLGLDICKNCFLVQISNIINNRNIFNKDYSYFSSYSKTWLDHSKKLVNFCIRKYKLNKNSKVLEIASNDGYLLNFFKKKKIKCLGIEPSESVAKISKKKGIKTFTNFFTSKFVKENKIIQNPNIIIGLNVIAHTPKLNDFLRSLNLAMNLKTICILEFPYLINLIKKKQIDTIYHEHYSYFSMTSFINLLIKNNLIIYDYKFIKTHGGSVRVFIKKNLKKETLNHKIKRILLIEKKIGIKKIDFYKNFSKSIKQLIFKNKSKLKKFNINNNIIGYGAAAKSTIFCNLHKLSNKDIKYICDKNPFKQKKFIPGTNIKIYSPNKLINSDSKIILIFPWNLKKEIIKQIKSSTKTKYKYISFEPNLRINK